MFCVLVQRVTPHSDDDSSIALDVLVLFPTDSFKNVSGAHRSTKGSETEVRLSKVTKGSETEVRLSKGFELKKRGNDKVSNNSEARAMSQNKKSCSVPKSLFWLS